MQHGALFIDNVLFAVNYWVAMTAVEGRKEVSPSSTIDKLNVRTKLHVQSVLIRVRSSLLKSEPTPEKRYFARC